MAKRLQFTMTISDQEQVAALHQWMKDNEIAEGKYAEACRTLIQQALASTPKDGAMHAAQRRAYAEVKQYAMGKVIEFFHDLKENLRELEQQGAFEQNGERSTGP